MMQHTVPSPLPVMLGGTRLIMGVIFLWAFFDKLFGLNYATAADAGWLDGVSPTYGYLRFASSGPLQSLFHTLAGNVVVDWLFMGGLFLIGLGLLAGVAYRITTFSGLLLLSFIWLSGLPPEHNPIIDEHIVYMFVLLILYYTQAQRWLGLGDWWIKQPIVRRLPFLH